MLSIITWYRKMTGMVFLWYWVTVTSPLFAFSWQLQTHSWLPWTMLPCPWSCSSLSPWPGTSLMPLGGKHEYCPPDPVDIWNKDHIRLTNIRTVPVVATIIIKWQKARAPHYFVCTLYCCWWLENCMGSRLSSFCPVWALMRFHSPPCWCGLIGGHNSTSQPVHSQLQRHLVLLVCLRLFVC